MPLPKTAGERVTLQLGQHTTALAGIQLYEARLQSWLSEDVFRRRSASESFPLLPLQTTYVEPLAVVNQQDERTPVLQAVIESTTKTSGIVVLQAPFGYGKSLSCRYLAATSAARWLSGETPALPVYIHTPSVLQGHLSTLAAAVQHHFQIEMEISPRAAQWLWDNVPMLLILDSYDEVVQNDRQAKEWVKEMQREAPRRGLSILLATRPYGIKLEWLGSDDKVVTVSPFSVPQIDAWLSQTEPYLGHGLNAATLIEGVGIDIASTPILLLMAAWSWSSSVGKGTKGRTWVYASFLDKVSRGKWTEVQDAHPMVSQGADRLDELAGRGSFQRALAMIAWEHAKAERRSAGGRSNDFGLTVQDVNRHLHQRFCRYNDRSLTEEHLEQVTQSMVLSLFFRRGESSDRIRFSHKSFREYLCAEHLQNLLTAHETSALSQETNIELLSMTVEYEECLFFGDLIRQRAENRERVLRFLDSAHEGPRIAVTSEDAAFSTHSVRPPKSVQLVFAKVNLAWNLIRNGARLAAAVRWEESDHGCGKLNLRSMFNLDLPHPTVDWTHGQSYSFVANSGLFGIVYRRSDGQLLAVPIFPDVKLAATLPPAATALLDSGAVALVLSAFKSVWLGYSDHDSWLYHSFPIASKDGGLPGPFPPPSILEWIGFLSHLETHHASIRWPDGSWGVMLDGTCLPLLTIEAEPPAVGLALTFGRVASRAVRAEIGISTTAINIFGRASRDAIPPLPIESMRPLLDCELLSDQENEPTWEQLRAALQAVHDWLQAVRGRQVVFE